MLRKALKFFCREEARNQSSPQQPRRRTLNAMFAANHLGFRNGFHGTVIGKRGMQSREVNARLARVPVNHSRILKVLAEDEMRFK
jgi:hypothetical protein